MRKKHSNKGSNIIFCVCIAFFLLCVIWLIYYFVGNGETDREMEELKNSYVVAEPIATAVTAPTEAPMPESIPTPEITQEPIPTGVVIDGKEYPGTDDYQMPGRTVDFTALQQEENEHIYAWLYIPNTVIDYPVLQHPDEPEYYLRRNTKGKKATAGCLFTQYYNNKDFNDNNTVIYGHNMRNGSMFHDLHKYEDEQFFADNPYIYVYTETENRVYQVFGAYEYGNVHLLLSFNMNSDEQFGNYLEGLTTLNGKNDNFNWDIGVSNEDKILTLSTCVTGNESRRYLVQAKLVAVETLDEKNEAEETITE